MTVAECNEQQPHICTQRRIYEIDGKKSVEHFVGLYVNAYRIEWAVVHKMHLNGLTNIVISSGNWLTTFSTLFGEFNALTVGHITYDNIVCAWRTIRRTESLV